MRLTWKKDSEKSVIRANEANCIIAQSEGVGFHCLFQYGDSYEKHVGSTYPTLKEAKSWSEGAAAILAAQAVDKKESTDTNRVRVFKWRRSGRHGHQTGHSARAVACIWVDGWPIREAMPYRARVYLSHPQPRGGGKVIVSPDRFFSQAGAQAWCDEEAVKQGWVTEVELRTGKGRAAKK
jgi:hypothetical protein